MDDDMAFLFGAPPKPAPKKKLKKPTPASSTDDATPQSKTKTTPTPSHSATSPPEKTTIKSKSTTTQTADHDEIDLFGAPTITKSKKQRKLADATTTLDANSNDTPLLDAPSPTTISNINQTKKSAPKSFSQLGISSWLISTLSKLRIVIPTDIQLKSIPSIIKGDNVIARAKTGSGKTAAFALPILETLSHDPYGIYALVLTPTRELALQIKDQFDIFGSPIGLTTVCVIGGVDMVRQSQALENRPHIVIATPGRLSDLLVRGSVPNFGAKHMKFLVLDEADRLFEDCFVPFLDTILDHIPPISERQTVLVSATLTNELVQSFKNHPLFPRLVPKETVYHQSAQDDDNIVEKLTQSYLFFPQAIKECYISYLLSFANPSAKNAIADDVDREHNNGIMKKRHHNGQTKMAKGDGSLASHGATDAPKVAQHPTAHHQSCIVFCKTVKSAQFLSLFLTEMGVRNVPLHSLVKQSDRIANLNKFRSGSARVLVATDIAARGLDIPQVTLVINYELPHTHQDYIHRVGRTARANRHGIALTLVTQYDVKKLQALEEEVGIKLTEFAGVDEALVIENLRVVNEKKKYAQVLIDEIEEAKEHGL